MISQRQPRECLVTPRTRPLTDRKSPGEYHEDYLPEESSEKSRKGYWLPKILMRLPQESPGKSLGVYLKNLPANLLEAAWGSSWKISWRILKKSPGKSLDSLLKESSEKFCGDCLRNLPTNFVEAAWEIFYKISWKVFWRLWKVSWRLLEKSSGKYPGGFLRDLLEISCMLPEKPSENLMEPTWGITCKISWSLLEEYLEIS